MFVLAAQATQSPSQPYPPAERLYRIGKDSSISTLRVARELGGWAQLALNDRGDGHLFAEGHGHPWHLLLEPDAEPDDLDVERISRVEYLGDQLHLWFGDGRHASQSDQGVWSQQPAIVVEGHQHLLTSLDGHGGHASYALDELDETGNYDLWSFDGHTTEFVGVVDWWGNRLSAVPTGHPVDPGHEHAIYQPTGSGVRLWWPRRPLPAAIDIPLSPTYAEASDGYPCLFAYGLTATRTSDGRVWLAWIVGLDGGFCEDDPAVTIEAGTVRLVEVDPAQLEAREVMRVPINANSILRTDLDIWVYYEYPAMSLASYGQDVAIVLADGPDDQSLRVLRVDTAALQ